MSGISRATFERDPKTNARLRTPAGRALALTAWLAASAAIVVAFAAELWWLVGVGLLAWIFAMGAVNTVAGGMTVMRDAELDERELALREGGLAAAHRFTGVVLVLGMVLATAVLGDSVDKSTVLALLSGLLLLQLGGPSIAIALRARLPEPE